MSYNLFLDDERIPEGAYRYTNMPVYILHDWIVVKNYDEFTEYIKLNGIPNMISFDHDLVYEHYNYNGQSKINYNVGEKTGYHCAQWLINHCLDGEISIPLVILIHSMNVSGSENIKSLFDTYNKVHGEVSENEMVINCPINI